MKTDLHKLLSESRNPDSEQIDRLSTREMLKMINNEDQKVALAVEQTIPDISEAVDLICSAFQSGGRLIYSGAGTSGRLGVLDASECPPTFGCDAALVVALIAGGQQAILHAVENAEDKAELGAGDLRAINFSAKDVLVGIAASGRTPYVLGAMQYALSAGASVVSLSCNAHSPMHELAHINITPIVGPEVLSGSSRMKAGTAQKLVLNMLTTGAMIRNGKVFSNLMVDVQATNDKLVQRQKNIVMEVTGCSAEQAENTLIQSANHCKTAILMLLSDLDADSARQKLNKHNGFLRHALADSSAHES